MAKAIETKFRSKKNTPQKCRGKKKLQTNMLKQKSNLFSRTEAMPCFEYEESLDWNTGHVLVATQEMICTEHKKCLAGNPVNVLLGVQWMSCLDQCFAWSKGSVCWERTECLAWNTGSVLRGTQGAPSLEHKECSASNIEYAMMIPKQKSFLQC